MKYTDGIKLFNKNAAEWAMAIFFNSANEAHGFMRRSTNNYLVTGELDQEDKEFVYRPEADFLARVTDHYADFFRKIYDDCMRTYPDGTPWLEKIRYRAILSKQLDLDPINCKSEIDIHTYRKALVTRWFQVLGPYLANYELAHRSFFPGVIYSHVSNLTTSVSLLSARDNELGLNDLGGIVQAIRGYASLHGDIFPTISSHSTNVAMLSKTRSQQVDRPVDTDANNETPEPIIASASDTTVNLQVPLPQPGSQPSMRILGQYLKDLSFESPNAPQALAPQQSQPDINIVVNVNARNLTPTDFEVELHLDAKATSEGKVMFASELLFAGVFRMENFPASTLYAAVLIECPRMLFPFARHILADVTRNGGFPPLMVDPIDFAALYQKRMAQQEVTAAKT